MDQESEKALVETLEHGLHATGMHLLDPWPLTQLKNGNVGWLVQREYAGDRIVNRRALGFVVIDESLSKDDSIGAMAYLQRVFNSYATSFTEGGYLPQPLFTIPLAYRPHKIVGDELREVGHEPQS